MEQTIQQLKDGYKNCNICITEILKEEERKSRRKFWKKKIMAENFPKLMIVTKLQIQGKLKNTTQEKYQKFCTWAHHIPI